MADRNFEKYKRIKLLNEGSYGKAYLVEAKSDNSLCVIKQIQFNDRDPTVMKEAIYLREMHHPNIIQFKDVYFTKSKKLCIVMEYADGGDLSSKIKHLKENNMMFSEQEIIDYFYQICAGMKYCHDK